MLPQVSLQRHEPGLNFFCQDPAPQHIAGPRPEQRGNPNRLETRIMQETPTELETPLRGEPFSVEHLWQHAEQLATQHSISPRIESETVFIDRFESNRKFISNTYQAITEAIRSGRPLTSDAEWILDNYYIIEEQLREIHEDLPQGFYRELPKLKEGENAGLPRVYDLAHELITHTDSSLDEDLISGFIAAYQRVTPLTTGEIWAVPIMLRLVLVENLRRLCSHVITVHKHRTHAKELLNSWKQRRPAQGSHQHFMKSPTLVMQLIECLRESGKDPEALTFTDLVHCFGVEQQAIDECIHCEQNRLAANQVSIGNLITSMRLLTALDWTLFFERVSLVEPILRQDPVRVYSHMDFATRDLYRHQIEELAKRGKIDEITVATAALDLSMEAERSEDQDPRTRHIGYYLIDHGRLELEGRLKISPRPRWIFERKITEHAAWAYPAAVLLGTLLGVLPIVRLARANNVSWSMTILWAIAALIPVSEAVVSILNALITNLIRPRILPKIEFTNRIPPHFHAIVVVPCMFTNSRGVAALIQRLEIHYLSNPEEGLNFALLSDFPDASDQTLATDEELLQQTRAGIARLNSRYAKGAEQKFFLLHRERKWNANDGVWMGWERKRGKLIELNRLLRGLGSTSFLNVGELPSKLRQMKYVITLDSDTKLPHGTAKKLIGTMAHPLNRAVVDRELGHVIHGYGILQPRVSVSMDSASKSWFARICANSPGLDPYSTAVSDVYQDLHGEGSYTGKGIYDIDAFCQCVDETFPENRILSHDLIEGCYARSGLVTDIEFFDDFPARYDADARRQHRWVRGDWQLITHLLPTVDRGRSRTSNTLSLLSFWKIADNLRRSLLYPTLFAFLVMGWLQASPSALTISAIGFVVLSTPIFAHMVAALFHKPHTIGPCRYIQDLCRDLGKQILQSLLSLTFVPFKAHLMLDAICRTLYRVFVSRKNLLEWESADATERRLSSSPVASFVNMSWVSLLSLVLLILLPAPAKWGALPILLLWELSPLVGYWISRLIPVRKSSLTATEVQELRFIARKTWAYFEHFVGEEDHWLPPDNCQEHPVLKVAHRLSPTNEGLYLVSSLAAYQFGYQSLVDLVDRLEGNLESLDRLDRHFGHFYNWYDTTTLLPLAPRYVSTADSGNLAVSLLTSKQGIEQILKSSLLDRRRIAGLEDSINLVERALKKRTRSSLRSPEPPGWELNQTLSSLRTFIKIQDPNLRDWKNIFLKIHEAESLLAEQCQRVFEYLGSLEVDVTAAIVLLQRHISGMQRDWERYLNWIPQFLQISEQDSPNIITPKLEALCDPPGTLSLEKISQLPELLSPILAESNRSEEKILLKQMIETSAQNAKDSLGRLRYLADRYEALALEMDFRTVYNPQRRLFAVGYNKDEGRMDRSHYDLLASESRLASLIAIAKGDVEHRHWFNLGRTLTVFKGEKSLLSWGGTMFEFLMPALFLKDYPDSLLDISCRTAVRAQIEYGWKRNVPWGISESAYGAIATNSDYQYQSFGVPGMGLKRGLANDLVISPYSTGLALVIDPAAAAANFRHLSAEGAEGAWGFYDALDYTSERVPPGDRRIVVRNYMAHHHGMTMAGLANSLLDDWVRKCFQSLSIVRTTEILLQEQIPVSVLEFQPNSADVQEVPDLPVTPGPVSRRLSTYDTPRPKTHLLSNGQYSVMLTNSGSGYSKCGNLAITRWRPDPTRDDSGQYIYLRRKDTEAVWSAGFQPTQALPSAYEVTYSMDKGEYRRRDGDIETLLEVAISPENNAEIRHLTISNQGRKSVEVEVTSYAEIVLADPKADASHPAFSKLFVETEYIPEFRALLAKRRPRDATQAPIWGVHVVTGTQSTERTVEYETDREKFVGRCRSMAQPAAMLPGVTLTGTVGPVLDPVFSLRQTLEIPPKESVEIAFITAYAETREEALLLADQYHDVRSIQRTFEMAWAHSQVEHRHLQISPAGMHLYQRIAAALLYPDPNWRSEPETLLQNRSSQSSLWKYGISGDHPIVLLQITRPEQRTLLREVLLAHEFWHAHGLKADLIVLNDYPVEYFDTMHLQLQEIIQSGSRFPVSKPGGVYLLKTSFIAPEDLILMKSAAAVTLHGDRGSLLLQTERRTNRSRYPDGEVIRKNRISIPDTKPHLSISETKMVALQHPNGFGGFSESGKEYVIELSGGNLPPAPWSNVIANPQFGCLITESGGGYTWAGNSRESKLTGWSNDPVLDTPSEVLYLRDELTGETWTPAPSPNRESSRYSIQHGKGYSRFHHDSHSIQQELLISIAPQDPIKFACLKLRNESDQPRVLTATYFAEWVIGVNRSETQTHVWTKWDQQCDALFARNYYREDAPRDQVVFLKAIGELSGYTADRSEFIGRNGSLQRPDGLNRLKLTGTTGAGYDPCGSIQVKIDLEPGESREVFFLLGACSGEEATRELLMKYSDHRKIHEAIEQTQRQWEETSGKVELITPNTALNILVNEWLLYQTLSCRIWGRSAFYQSGGAYGFRDQLQDVMALVVSHPEEARRQLLRAAARQFEEGDVQHWWHPPTGRGVRTRFSDDYLWLPFVTCHYVKTTGDRSVLQEQIPYVKSAILAENEEERYELPEITEKSESLYDHCVRAIKYSRRYGEHGLPLMGGGDWNDGMNKIGIEGKGESVWLAWFLITLLREFAQLAQGETDASLADECLQEAATLLKNAEEHAWDGNWYLRAFFDDGQPIGSSQNMECRIDSIAQSWAVIAGADPQRVRRAMNSVYEKLVKDDARLILLFAPPFDQTPLNPGYIKGYLPGIRENGGQYTHAALWTVIAATYLKEGTKAVELFDLLNPVLLASNENVSRYRGEPYVVAADVYGMEPHVGRAGWTWYTGSASWMYRTAVEMIAGIQCQGDQVILNPCIPATWPEYQVKIRKGDSLWNILIRNPDGREYGINRLKIDGQIVEGNRFTLIDDGRSHTVEANLYGEKVENL